MRSTNSSREGQITSPPQLNGIPVGMTPANPTYPSIGTYGLTVGAGAQLGVYQKLATRNGGEVISSDPYRSERTCPRSPHRPCIVPASSPPVSA
jgi:hypothetical protein